MAFWASSLSDWILAIRFQQRLNVIFDTTEDSLRVCLHTIHVVVGEFLFHAITLHLQIAAI